MVHRGWGRVSTQEKGNAAWVPERKTLRAYEDSSGRDSIATLPAFPKGLRLRAHGFLSGGETSSDSCFMPRLGERCEQMVGWKMAAALEFTGYLG